MASAAEPHSQVAKRRRSAGLPGWRNCNAEPADSLHGHQRLVDLMHAQVQVIDHPRPVGVFTQLFFQEAGLLRGPELGIDEFLSSARGEWLAMKSSMAFSLESRPSWSNKPSSQWVGESMFISLRVASSARYEGGFNTSEGAALQGVRWRCSKAEVSIDCKPTIRLSMRLHRPQPSAPWRPPGRQGRRRREDLEPAIFLDLVIASRWSSGGLARMIMTAWNSPSTSLASPRIKKFTDIKFRHASSLPIGNILLF